MRPCPACSTSVPDEAIVCPRCGVPLDRTVAPSGALEATRVTGPGPIVLASSPSERFAPGALIAGRYRVVARLGVGGMGEVYRADDLKLGQSVALKFLPEGLERDPDRLDRFMAEVRTARQVSHPNVCRVHDVDEFDGQHFLSMEYVDGEDLSSLLRRIGRLPEERAVEVARQICAGLAAAHDAGVLHRDLKPANVMLDGRGRVKITDFGLASLADAADGDEIRAGTPAYMAPEQLAGESVSVRSDLYALGLVLYELFTGRPVFQAQTLAELQTLHSSTTPSRPTSHVDSLDPAVETVVMRCLEKDPQRRPTSAIAVAAGLPGGDPLAAALAAGETPSPQLVAEAGAREAWGAPRALGMAVLAIVILLGGSYWAATRSLVAYFPFEKRPEVLRDRAHDLLADLGYTEDVYTDPVDQAWGWIVWGDVLRQVAERDTSGTWWDGIRRRPDVGGFWYRQSPRPLVPQAEGDAVLLRGPVELMDPHPTSAGEVMVLFDLDGSLRRFEVLPRRYSVDPPAEPDWAPLFEAAELDTTRFRPVTPRYQRFMTPDLRRAWLGTIEDQPGVEYRVEAGAFEGRPVLFNVAAAATLEELAEPPVAMRTGLGERVATTLPPLMILAIILLVSRLTARNLEGPRADTRGAFRFGVAILVGFVVSVGLRAHALAGPYFANELWHLMVAGTFVGFAMWAMYVAIEPVGRQVWPTMFVASSRLLSRERPQLRDPILGRSVLIGLLIGGAWYVVMAPANHFVRAWFAAEPLWPFGINLNLVHGGTRAMAQVLDLPMVFATSFLQISALVLLQRAVKRRWLAASLAVLVWTLLDGIGSPLAAGVSLVGSIVSMAVLLRWGVIAFVAAQMAVVLAWHCRTTDPGHWTSQGATFAIVLVFVLALYGAWAATGRSDAIVRRRT